MPKTSLITGATSGIGAAFARQLAAEGCSLVLVARDANRLETTAESLRQQYGVGVDTLQADLSTDQGMAAVEERLHDTTAPIDLLINNAAFGLRGGFVDIPVDEHDRMLQVNMRAVLRLTHAAVAAMVPRQSGGVINVSSVAGYIPGFRKGGTYEASKAFVTALTEGVAHSIKGTGVTVSVVCPGFVRSEFHQRAGIDMSHLPSWLWWEPDTVVKVAIHDHRGGQVVSIPGMPYKVIVLMTRFAPRSLMQRATRLVSRRSGKGKAK